MDIGQNIREYREKKNISLTEIAKATGYSIGFISQIERNLANPSINALKKISDALGMPLAAFFAESDNEAELIEADYIVRKNARKKLVPRDHKVQMFLLSPHLNHNIELVLIQAEPGGKSGDECYTHKGEEAGMVICGSLHVELDGKRFVLNEGDSIQIKSDIPHRWENKGIETSLSIWAITPPSF